MVLSRREVYSCFTGLEVLPSSLGSFTGLAGTTSELLFNFPGIEGEHGSYVLFEDFSVGQ